MVSRSVAFTLIASVLLIFIIAAHASPRRARRAARRAARSNERDDDLGRQLNLSGRALPALDRVLRRVETELTRAATTPATDPSGDPTCHTALHTGYSGDGARVWGLGKPGFHLKSAAECCKACQSHAATCSQPGSEHNSWWPDRPELKCGRGAACNIWTFCPVERCFAFDIHKHEFGECWLKWQTANHTHPKDPHEGHKTYPTIMRHAPRKIWPWAVSEEIWTGPMPERVPWTSGVLAPADAKIVSAPPDDKWRRRWCERHGPCTD